MYSTVTNKSAIWSKREDVTVSRLVIKRALSSPTISSFPHDDLAPFPKELQERAAAVRQSPSPEPLPQWSRLCFVRRRETMVFAKARIVFLEGRKKQS